MSYAPSELEQQKAFHKRLKDKNVFLKKKIIYQAKLNLSLDSKLQQINACKYYGENNNDMNNTLIIGNDTILDVSSFSKQDVSYSLIDNSMNTAMNSTFNDTMSNSVNKILKNQPMNALNEVEDTELTSLGDRVDINVVGFGQALTGLNGCWTDQSRALANTIVVSLRRIVPDTAAVTSSNSVNKRKDLKSGLINMEQEGIVYEYIKIHELGNNIYSAYINIYRYLYT